MCMPASRLGEARRATQPGVVYLWGHHIVWVDEQGVGWEHQEYGDTHLITNTRGERWECMNSLFKLNQNYTKRACVGQDDTSLESLKEYVEPVALD
ncbi:hypothetical protein M3Y99_01318300 [Aphelenchoides fujianensis]|nr:hypothetical protein M3Y99_01318300 [Aphelenchoides fujianensis]